MLFKSTRGSKERLTASEAILQGLAKDGGLYVPEEIPKLPLPIEAYQVMSYQDIAYRILSLYLTDYSKDELKDCIRYAYDSKWDDVRITPVKTVGEVHHLELFHGPTLAFKDIALTMLPHLMTVAAKKNNLNKEIVILTATSGDTGKAALAGFAGVEGTKVIVFYPEGGVSKIQEMQMTTQKEDNTLVLAIKGNFDQAQNGVKKLFQDKEFNKELDDLGYLLTSANSINIGRLLPQIVYYVYAYAKLLARGVLSSGEILNVTVPTGNFGNILAAYYAKEMGVPIGKLICASNENTVLFDFFQTGVYDKNRTFKVTSSPSMDIVISSNLERLIYAISGKDAFKNKTLMEELTTKGSYTITPEMKEHLLDFESGFATEEQTNLMIRKVYEENGYVMDPHTAVASFVNRQVGHVFKTQSLVVSTASPYKFVGSVMEALDPKTKRVDELELIGKLESVSKVRIPKPIKEVLQADIKHTKVIDENQMKEVVREFLK